jgi:two-component system NtrC family sensor kinase
MAAILLDGKESEAYALKDASGAWYECSASSLIMPDRSRVIVEIISDITEKKKAEKVIQEFAQSLKGIVAEKTAELKKSEELYQTLLENANDAIFTIDPESNRVLSANRMAALITGYRIEELITMRTADLLGHGEFDIIRDCLRESAGVSGIFSRVEIVQKGGSRVPADASASRILYNGKQIVMLICRDVSQRLRIDRRMRQLASVVENIASSVILTDLDQNIIYVNHATITMLGYREEEMLGRRSSEFFEGIPGNPPRLAELIERESSDGSWEGEIFNRSKSGEVFPVHLRMCTIKNERGEIIGYAGIADDITTHRKMEQELIQKEKLSALGELISGIAHELNNPLTGVLGYTEIILNSECPPAVKEDAQRLYKEVVRCHYLVKNLLTFGRRPVPHKDFADINAVLENSIKLKSHQLKADHIELVAHLDRDIPMALLDHQQMQQVFLNILNNAHHALTEKRGKRLITVRSAVREGHIEVSIGNNGSHIADDALDKIFSPFYSTKKFGHGTGLGLSIALGIVKDHGGDIRVESHEGSDTVFTVTLPAAR